MPSQYIEFREFYPRDSFLEPIPVKRARLFLNEEFLQLWRMAQQTFSQFREWEQRVGIEHETIGALRFSIPRSWCKLYGTGNLNLHIQLEICENSLVLVLTAPDNDEYAVTETEYAYLPLADTDTAGS